MADKETLKQATTQAAVEAEKATSVTEMRKSEDKPWAWTAIMCQKLVDYILEYFC